MTARPVFLCGLLVAGPAPAWDDPPAPPPPDLLEAPPPPSPDLLAPAPPARR